MPSKSKKAPTTSSSTQEDVHMSDDPPSASATAAPPPQQQQLQQQLQQQQQDYLQGFDGQKIRVLPGSLDTAASFEFTGEDHTLGNALRYIIMKNPDVEFCGYSIPHPSEPKMNLRIQTYEGTAFDALEKGFGDLMDLCDVVADKFATERVDFAARTQ